MNGSIWWDDRILGSRGKIIMEASFQRSVSQRPSRRADQDAAYQKAKGNILDCFAVVLSLLICCEHIFMEKVICLLLQIL